MAQSSTKQYRDDVAKKYKSSEVPDRERIPRAPQRFTLTRCVDLGNRRRANFRMLVLTSLVFCLTC
jgi:hypothetical protein